ncbi:MAG TPA: 1,4-alpha-glucan branching enzyme, partial [Marmoricola sp.]|nr:1,4-alpha-glucan branching enzyme [Marmoricola sp.]
MTSLGEIDLHLINEGRHERLWQVLGALVADHGTTFRVWAPNAIEVQVLGDFNDWSGAHTPMVRVGDSGVWEASVPGLGSGEKYQFQIRGADGSWRAKADPMAGWAEIPPQTASRTFRSTH